MGRCETVCKSSLIVALGIGRDEQIAVGNDSCSMLLLFRGYLTETYTGPRLPDSPTSRGSYMLLDSSSELGPCLWIDQLSR